MERGSDYLRAVRAADGQANDLQRIIDQFQNSHPDWWDTLHDVPFEVGIGMMIGILKA